MSYCLCCHKEVNNKRVTAVDPSGHTIICLWDPLISLCPDCYNLGWRLDMYGKEIRAIQMDGYEDSESEVSLLDLLTNGENK